MYGRHRDNMRSFPFNLAVAWSWVQDVKRGMLRDEFAVHQLTKKKEHLHASEALKKSYEGDMLIAMSSDAK